MRKSYASCFFFYRPQICVFKLFNLKGKVKNQKSYVLFFFFQTVVFTLLFMKQDGFQGSNRNAVVEKHASPSKDDQATLATINTIRFNRFFFRHYFGRRVYKTDLCCQREKSLRNSQLGQRKEDATLGFILKRGGDACRLLYCAFVFSFIIYA